MLVVHGSSESGLFTHLPNHVFGVRIFRNAKTMRVILFSKCLKFKLDFKNAAKNCENVFCFWDNCIWIGIVKLSLLRTGYFSLAANGLTSSTKILHVNKRDFCHLNWLGSDQWIWERCCDVHFNSALAGLLHCLSKGPLKRDILDIYLTTLSESVISEIQNLWGSSFFSKYSKCKIAFKNAARNWEKCFLFLRCLHLNWYG